MLLILFLAPALTESLKCWIGWQNWTEEPAVSDIILPSPSLLYRLWVSPGRQLCRTDTFSCSHIVDEWKKTCRIGYLQIDNVRLAECPRKAECCAFVTSLNGNQFGCNETCPPKHYRWEQFNVIVGITTCRLLLYFFVMITRCRLGPLRQCGPDPRSGIQDLRYCYCRSHHDPRYADVILMNVHVMG